MESISCICHSCFTSFSVGLFPCSGAFLACVAHVADLLSADGFIHPAAHKRRLDVLRKLLNCTVEIFAQGLVFITHGVTSLLIIGYLCDKIWVKGLVDVMYDIEKIQLTFQEKVLLKYIQKYGISDQCFLANTKSFKMLSRYGFLEGDTSKKYPPKYLPGTKIQECNAYRAVSDSELYWRHLKSVKSEKRSGFVRDVILLILGSLITLAVEHLGQIVDFLAGIWQQL